MSMGGLSYHMGQFHIAQLFPENRGLVSSLYVGAFIASGVVFEVVRAIFNSVGGGMQVFRAIMITFAVLGMVFVPLMLWMAPTKSFIAGQQYKFDRHAFRFLVLSTHDPPPPITDENNSVSILSSEGRQQGIGRALTSDGQNGQAHVDQGNDGPACAHCKIASSCKERQSIGSQCSDIAGVPGLAGHKHANATSKQRHVTAPTSSPSSSGELHESCQRASLDEAVECQLKVSQGMSPAQLDTEVGKRCRAEVQRWARPRRVR
jgi:hypothetical protein